MHVTSLLCTTLLTFLVHLGNTRGSPTAPRGVTIPLTRVADSRGVSNLPPAIVHQQHVNRGLRRLEVMHGREPASDYDLITNLQKRASTLSPTLRKRYHSISGISNDLSSFSAYRSSTSDKGQSFAAANDISSVTKAKEPTFHNTIGLDIQARDRGYIGTVKLGTPPRDYKLLVDSGSADLWVGAEGCTGPGDDGCGHHRFLGRKTSSSFNDTKKGWTIQYGTGAVTGHIITDHLSIGGLQLKAHKFGVALNETEDFTPDYIPFDGIMGLARSMISRQQTTTVVEALQKAGLIKDAITSYKISRLADGKHDGEMTLGAMNPAKYDGKTLVTVSNINRMGFWEVPLGGIKVNGKNMGWTNRTAIMDTGTSLIIAPEQDVKAIHESIPGAYFDGSGWTVPCTTTASISFSIGGREFSIDHRDIPWMPVDSNAPKGNCTSGFSSGDIGSDNEWLVGDVFLKNVYMSTHVGTNKITFAKLA